MNPLTIMNIDPNDPVIEKLSKKQYLRDANSNYWRNKFMQVLEAMAENELTWSESNWQFYGVTEQDKENINKEFAWQVRWREKKNKVDTDGEIER